MGQYSSRLPQLDRDAIFLTDGGLETVMIFREGLDLPHFAACELLNDAGTRATLRRYFDEYAAIATERGVGFIVDTATWRANPDWTRLLGYDDDQFEQVNRAAVDLAVEVRSAWERPGSPMPISGVVGPRGDGYRPDTLQSVEDARAYHGAQIDVFAATGDVDFISAVTMTYPEEAAGIALAARDAGLPVVISFTVETDGRLVTGATLQDAIAAVDRATDGYPSYYMVNCAHPTHLPEGLGGDQEWSERLRGYRANASSLSHAELDEAEELDSGDAEELARQYARLRTALPGLTILGGCCGTDASHVAAIAAAVRPDRS
jgi:S-methylmethionine-dependent homocysteine/selenocysteine methylase